VIDYLNRQGDIVRPNDSAYTDGAMLVNPNRTRMITEQTGDSIGQPAELGITRCQ
jgi:hypothetical protein